MYAAPEPVVEHVTPARVVHACASHGTHRTSANLVRCFYGSRGVHCTSAARVHHSCSYREIPCTSAGCGRCFTPVVDYTAPASPARCSSTSRGVPAPVADYIASAPTMTAALASVVSCMTSARAMCAAPAQGWSTPRSGWSTASDPAIYATPMPLARNSSKRPAREGGSTGM